MRRQPHRHTFIVVFAECAMDIRGGRGDLRAPWLPQAQGGYSFLTQIALFRGGGGVSSIGLGG